MTQASFTLDTLKEVMLTAVGEDDSIDLDRDILDVPMSELGFDSLAVMNVADEIERDCGVRIPEDALDEIMATPRRTLEYINELLAAGAPA
jgi:act minimal PKS acyl carrier protein